MDLSRLFVPLLAVVALGAIAVMFVGDSLAQTRALPSFSEDEFHAMARQGEGAEDVSRFAGPVARASDLAVAKRLPPAARAEAIARARFVLPMDGWWGVTDVFGLPRGEGKVHTGIDLGLAGHEGSPVYSSCDGVVTVAEYNSGYGNYVIVDCGDGWSTVSAHFSEILVRVGAQVVQRESVLGLSGSTGNSTGEHLHFEIRWQGVPVDPAEFLEFGPVRGE